MPKLQLKDVWGKSAWEHYAQTEPPYSEAFDKALAQMWDKFGVYGLKPEQKALRPEAWDYIKENLLPVINPQNKMESYILCNAIRHLKDPPDFEYATDNLFVGLAGFAYEEISKQFPNTALGDFADYVVNPPEFGPPGLIFSIRDS